MGNKLFKNFGVDIAATVNKSLGKSLLPGVLFKVTPGTRTTGNLTGGTNPRAQRKNFRGFYEDYEDSEINGTLIKRGDRKVYMLGDSIQDGAIPETNDQVLLENETKSIVGIPARDPDAAGFTCQVR